jgi:hypothetical protein
LDEIIKRWGREEITTEQAIGQILLLIKGLSERVGNLEQRMEARRRGKEIPGENEPR